MNASSAQGALRAQDYERCVATVDGLHVGITTYRIGDVYVCRIDNVDPGAAVSRATGASRDEARGKALGVGLARLARTRRFPI